MIESANGIILRTRPLTETSLIVNWLTPEFGRISTVAKGARNAKSSFRGKLDLFYEADFSFTRSRRSELHTLREMKLLEVHAALREDVGRLHQAAYCAALVVQTTEAETPLAEIHGVFAALLSHVARQPVQARAVFAFELKLLRILGLEPDASGLRVSAGAQRLIAALTDSAWESLHEMRADAAQARELRQFLHGFLIYHLGKIPKGRNAALHV